MISPLPVLARTAPSAKLTRRFGGMGSVAKVVMWLIDEAHLFTRYDWELAVQLGELARARLAEQERDEHERED